MATVLTRPGSARLSSTALANVLNAAGNTVSVFAISVAAADAASFDYLAACLGVLVLVFGVNRAVIGETLTLQRHVTVGVGGFVAASAIVAAALSACAVVTLVFASGTRSLAALTGMAIFCFLLNDAFRYWGFRAGDTTAVALSDGVWLLASGGLYVMAVLDVMGPRMVFASWAASGVLVAVPLLRRSAADKMAPNQGPVEWLLSQRSLSLRLAAEALAATAAVTLPLIAAPHIAEDDGAGGAVRLLQAFFGFQQVAFFSALVAFGRGSQQSRKHCGRAAAALMIGGIAASMIVGATVSLLPRSLLESVLGEAALEARRSIWSFVGLQVVMSVTYGVLLGLRLAGRAADATRPRVLGAIVATLLATVLISRGVAGYSVGSAIGALVFLVLSSRAFRAVVSTTNRSGTVAISR
ncbi:MAG: hypothetical protein AB7V43_03820 [Acidimicrobiia bacterium]